MNEVRFINSNIARWERFEQTLQERKSNDPDELAALYIQLTDDLAYAQTHYPKGEVTKYLNTLTSKVHSLIYKNKRQKNSRFINFWRYEVPEISFRYRKQLLYAFLIFGVSVLIGIVSAAHDEHFVRLILGDRYVNMTLQNIEKGDPMGVYKSMNQGFMFFTITFNNIRVSLTTFAAGIVFAVGTALYLFYNGVMLGSFQYFFFQKGLLATSMLSIWIHGTLEISAIIIAGAAGLIMGHGLLFPGTYARLESLKRSAKDGIKLVISLVPIFITAGFLESFITRLTGAPVLVKLAIILCSASFIVYYFIIYPTLLAKNDRFRKNATL